jgi:spermidine synthase
MRRHLFLLLILFLGSGCAALIYEVVWLQLLELIVGSSSFSVGILLGTFMGGMCLGSLLFFRVVPQKSHPLLVYGTIELCIGFLGILLLFGMPWIGSIYTAWAGSGFVGMLFRGVVAGICLLPPTVLMGATLPAISRWVEASSSSGIFWLGLFYGGNIAGAVVGSLLAGMYILRVHDAAIATFVAVALNIAVGLMGLAMAKTTPFAPVATESKQSRSPSYFSSYSNRVYVVLVLSGMTALASEVIWTRVVSLLFGATVYTFSLILAVFLIGLGTGSTVGSALSKRLRRPQVALAPCQILLCAALAWAADFLNRSLPYWSVDPATVGPWEMMRLDFFRMMWAILPAAILWGASFPLALAAIAGSKADPARLVGGLYAANTAGAIVGSLGASLLFVPWLGSQRTQQMLIGIAAVSALLVLVDKLQWRSVLRTVLISGYAGLLILTIPSIPPRLVEHGRFAGVKGQDDTTLYVGEGLVASVAVSMMPDGRINYHNSGKVEASSDPADMRFQRMLGHLTTLLPDNPRSVLVIGCGAAVTAGAVSTDPRLQKLTIVEIEPLVPGLASTYFSDLNFSVLENPKTTLQIDDGRHFLLTTNERFDAITSDPLDPWVKGTAALYTKEFFEAARQHLNPGGVVTQFVQLYNVNEDAVKSEIATFFEVFPHGAIFANTVSGQGYDLVLMGRADALPINIDTIEERLNSAEYGSMRRSMTAIGISSAVDLLSTFAGQASDLKPWLNGAAINHDRNLRLQYIAGLGLNEQSQDAIFKGMVAFARFPEQLFTGSTERMNILQQAISYGQNQ